MSMIHLFCLLQDERFAALLSNHCAQGEKIYSLGAIQPPVPDVVWLKFILAPKPNCHMQPVGQKPEGKLGAFIG